MKLPEYRIIRNDKPSEGIYTLNKLQKFKLDYLKSKEEDPNVTTDKEKVIDQSALLDQKFENELKEQFKMRKSITKCM